MNEENSRIVLVMQPPVLFSKGNLVALKSPPTTQGSLQREQIDESSSQKSCLFKADEGPYRPVSIQSNLES